MTHTSVEMLHQRVLLCRTEIWGHVLTAHIPRGHTQPPGLCNHISSIFLFKGGTADRQKPHTALTLYSTAPGSQLGSYKKIPKVNRSQEAHQQRHTMNHSFTASPGASQTRLPQAGPGHAAGSASLQPLGLQHLKQELNPYPHLEQSWFASASPVLQENLSLLLKVPTV